MSWREQLRPASFRGVAFEVLSAGGTFGRRTVLHEYPFRDLPYVEDLGRRARTMRIEAILLGDDYMARRDALIDAVEQAGSGKLVHPYYGELTVSLDDGGAQFDESTAQGGMARVTFSVIESGEAKFPAAKVATQDVVQARADTASLAVVAGFGAGLNVDGLPAFAFDSALGMVDDALSVVENYAGKLPGIGSGSVLGLIGLLRPDLAVLLREPLSLARRIQAVFASVRAAFDPPVASRVLSRLATFDSGAAHLPATTTTRQRETDNRAAIVELVRSSAVIERARVTTAIEFTDVGTATGIRESVVDQLDQVADTTANDALFQTLSALRAAVVRDIGERGASLARLVTITPAATVPALALAYDLHEDPSRDAEIVARNAIAHPGFLIAGVPLEVLSDA